MKKLFFLLPFILLSCSEDSVESETENQDPVIGIWKHVAVVYKFGSDPEYVHTYNSCRQQTRIYFKANGEITGTEKNSNQEEECIEKPVVGSWKKLSGNNYKFIMTVHDVNGDEEISTLTYEITFEDDEMRLHEEDSGWDEGDYEYELYSKVE